MDYNTIMSLWMYDFQNILESYSKMLEERKRAEDEENNKYNDVYKTNPNQLMKQYAPTMPKVPKVPNFNNINLQTNLK